MIPRSGALALAVVLVAGCGGTAPTAAPASPGAPTPIASAAPSGSSAAATTAPAATAAAPPIVALPVDGPTVIDVPATVAGRATIAPSGGTLEASGVVVSVPPGAVPAATDLVVTRLDAPFNMSPYARTGPDHVSATPLGDAWDLGPDGVRFDEPVTVTLPWDPADVPAGRDPADIAIGSYTGTRWVAMPATVDAVAHTASVRVEGFPGVALIVLVPATVILGSVVVFPTVAWYYGPEAVQTDAINDGNAADWITPDDGTVEVAADGATADGVPLKDPARLATLLRENPDPLKSPQVSLPGPDGSPVSLYGRYSSGTGTNWQRPATYLSTRQMRGDCTDISNALVSIFRNLGYPAKSVFGYSVDRNTPHVWGEVRIGGRPYLIDDDGMLSPLEEGLQRRGYLRPEPGDPRAAMWDENGQAVYDPDWWEKVPTVQIGRFDLASMVGAGADLKKFDDLVAENRVRIAYDKGADPASTRAKVTGTFSFILVFDDAFMWSIHEAVGSGLGADPKPMPETWRGCTSTATITGTLTGAQKAPGSRAYAGTATFDVASKLDGCERTGDDLTASAPQSYTKVPWTATGGESGLKGTIRSPAEGSANAVDWRFVTAAP